MKSLTKSVVTVFAVIFATLTLTVSIGMNITSASAASEDHAYEYFHSRLSYDARAEKFYSAFKAIAESGELKKGKLEYDVLSGGFTDVADVSKYVDGTDNKIIKAFGAGRDAFIMDHPDLFYVDLFGVSLSAGAMGGGYAAYLDSSRSLTLYAGGINTESAVDEAVAEYEAKLGEIVAAAKAAGNVKQQIEFVNGYLCEYTTYGFGTEVKDGRNVDTPAAAYINTAYGSIVNGEAICGGYAKGFKAIMDRLDIPCVCVQGYSRRNGNLEPHMWNYVELEGMWYAVDVTFNDAVSDHAKVLFVGGEKLYDTHIEDNVISSSGYELQYPAIKPYDYGTDTDDNGMTIVGEYKDSTDNTGKILELFVSFDGKNAAKLNEEGKHFIFRLGDTNKNTKQISWTQWYDSIKFGDVYSPLFLDKEDGSLCRLHAGIEFIQFALTERVPDDNCGAFYPTDKPDVYGELSGKPLYYAYMSETSDADSFFIGQPSAPYRNSGFGSYVPAPGAAGVYPANTGALPVDKTYDVRIVYNTELELDDNGTPAGMDYTVSRGNDTIKQSSSLTDFEWDGHKTVTFKFTPSKMYIHNSAMYYFVPTNLVGVNSKKIPDYVTYTFKGKSVVCSKVFNDGRLYMNVFGAPVMLDNSDLSVTDFKDEKGNYYAASQRSQLMLVASKPNGDEERELNETLVRETPIKDNEIIASSTYEINLQICGVVKKVPNGSYMQVAFGFPEGYDPDDKGTTFKIYHYKHDDGGNITGVEEIPVIITEYGLIAKVLSFSPFTIVQIKNTSEAVGTGSKNVYAYVNGIGGSVTTNGAGGISEVTGNEITYDIKADDGFRIGVVRLNGKAVDASAYAGGKLVLKADDIESSNTLEVEFITAEAVRSYAAKGVSLVFGGDPVTMTDDVNVAGIVIGCVAGVLVLAAGGFVLWWFVFRKRKAAAGSAPKKKSASAIAKPETKSKTSAATKPAINKSATTTKPSITATAKPATTKSAATKPVATKPVTTKPATTKPAATKPDAKTDKKNK